MWEVGLSLIALCFQCIIVCCAHFIVWWMEEVTPFLHLELDLLLVLCKIVDIHQFNFPPKNAQKQLAKCASLPTHSSTAVESLQDILYYWDCACAVAGLLLRLQLKDTLDRCWMNTRLTLTCYFNNRTFMCCHCDYDCTSFPDWRLSGLW